MGPTVWITKRAGRSKAGVALASPKAQPPSSRQASSSFGTGGTVDGAVDAPAARSDGFRRIDDRVDVFGDDVAHRDLEVRAHEAQRRFPGPLRYRARARTPGSAAPREFRPTPRRLLPTRKKPLALGFTTKHSNTTVVSRGVISRRSVASAWQGSTPMPEPLTMSPITSSLAASCVHPAVLLGHGERPLAGGGQLPGGRARPLLPRAGRSTREAKAVCRSCEVRVDCLEYPLAHGEKFGIWGGLSERSAVGCAVKPRSSAAPRSGASRA